MGQNAFTRFLTLYAFFSVWMLRTGQMNYVLNERIVRFKKNCQSQFVVYFPTKFPGLLSATDFTPSL